MTVPSTRVDELFGHFVEVLVVEGKRLDPATLCHDDHELLGELLQRIAKFEEVDSLLSTHRRLRTGRRLGGYEILSELGRGSMGIVYLASRLDDGDRVALKLFPPEREADTELLARFEREAHVIRKLDHPNVVKLHSIELVEEMRFLTLEYVEGTTLAKALPEGGFPLELVLAVATPLANALVCMHREGIIHRDLKLSNLMWTPEGELRILDFGVARLLGDASESLTRTGSVLGTICTMSPEQLLGEPIDARSDLFSFGAVLHQLATGRQAFRGDTLAGLIQAVLDLEPEPLPPGLGRLGRLIEQCLRKDRERRPRDAAEVEAVLRAQYEPGSTGEHASR